MTAALPTLHQAVEIEIMGGESYPSRVEDEDGPRLTLAAPLHLLVGDVPAAGTEVTLRWAGTRGRHRVSGKVVGTRNDVVTTWVVETMGPVTTEQSRHYVRGGGGEPAQLRHLADDRPAEPIAGTVVNLSERGVRLRFREIDPAVQEPVAVRLVLDDESVEVEGTVLRIIDAPAPQCRDVVVLFAASEHDATTIRRHVLRQQMLARSRARNE
ncbi:MAG TPA: PilZ domain-containing protein [Pilimelia sp.]|nr:PilZ domain-containing protein [Pilimelia sp.]